MLEVILQIYILIYMLEVIDLLEVINDIYARGRCYIDYKERKEST